MLSAAFLYLRFGFVTFWQKDVGKKKRALHVDEIDPYSI